MHNQQKKSLRQTLQLSFILIISLMLIPSVYSVIIMQIHTKQYDSIISNVNEANKIKTTIEKDIPNELWEIVCGKKSFEQGKQYIKIENILESLSSIKEANVNHEQQQNLEVAIRTCNTLLRNIQRLQTQIEDGETVTNNETLLDEIRTITSLFSDIMENFIILEVESADLTNKAIHQSSFLLSILQIGIILFSLIFSLRSYFTVSKSLNKPLQEMQLLSNKVASGNFTARTNIPDVNELAPLAKTLNSMVEQIDLLIKKNTEEQKNFQKAEMKALQAQITPHFLYNTFDTIIWLAEEEDTQKVIEITKAFSDFLRISLSKGHEWITVQQEIDHIKNYLTIQKIRYTDILNYKINVDSELSNYKMIKLILQPLIENAIYHGIKNKRGRGHITVTIKYENDLKNSILFIVEDDGAGFTEERLKEVQNELKTEYIDSEKLKAVYGLYNVHKKLCLYYGDRTDGLKIESEYKKGTTISFRIPCLSGENYV